jgi:pimeloyl-ACP methyl ester carboxylesterase
VAAPERVDRLVLCCTTPGGPATVPMPEVTVRLFAEAGTLPPEVALRRFVENALAPGASAGVVEDLYRRRLANPPDPVGWPAQAAAGMGFAGADGAIEAPTLLVTGTEDNVVDPRNTDVLAERIAGARVERILGTGHLFFWEQPDAFVRIVTEFLP